jgi:hypothetical protein
VREEGNLRLGRQDGSRAIFIVDMSLFESFESCSVPTCQPVVYIQLLPAAISVQNDDGECNLQSMKAAKESRHLKRQTTYPEIARWCVVEQDTWSEEQHGRFKCFTPAMKNSERESRT